MLLFSCISALLSIAVFMLLIRPMLQASKPESVTEEDASLLYQKRKQELDTELEKQTVDRSQYEELLSSYQKELYFEYKQQQESSTRKGFLTNKPFNLLLALSVPIIAGILYALIGGGSPAMKWRIPTYEDLQNNPEQLLIAFENKMAKEGGTAEEWHLLALSHRNRKQYDQAKTAFIKALELRNGDPVIQADYIELLILENDNEPTEASTVLLQQAINNHPEHPKLLWLAAMDAAYKNDSALQIDYLKRLAKFIPDDAPERQTVEKMITTLSGDTGNEAITVNVQLDIKEGLKKHITESSVLFVFAQAVTGPRMPLAVARLDPGDIPDTITLNDDMAMTPNMKLSDHETINITALISHSGQAQSSPGDLRGTVNNVSANNSATVSIIIDKIISE